jgi:hypothetical protein
MVSLWLRAGGSLRHVIKQLEGIGSSLQIPTRAGRIRSLGDGLACALKKYMRAKERFGLRPLLLGDIDLSELDREPSAVKATAVAGDRTVSSITPNEAPLPPAAMPRSNGNGKQQESGGGNGGSSEVVNRIERSEPSRLSDVMQSRAQAATPTVVHRSNGNGNSKHVQTVSFAADHAVATLELAPEADECEEVETAVALVDAPERQTESAPLPLTLTEVLGSVRHDRDVASGYALKCPQCGAPVAQQEGCMHCANHCGWAAC